jgi:hypothetical protein
LIETPTESAWSNVTSHSLSKAQAKTLSERSNDND